MKTFNQISVTFFMLIAFSLTAQQSINYKALIKDGGGNVVANDLIVVQFIIYQGPGEVTNVYQETHTPNTDANGIVMVNIGEGAVDNGIYADIDWGSDDHYLNVQINTGGGLTDMGTTQFMAVPYALNAANAATKINDLSDGKSDDDNSENGSSLFLGIDAGLNDDGTDNRHVGIGYQALFSNTLGFNNTAIGHQALYSNTDGNRNTALGTQALNLNSTGVQNTAVGSLALSNNITGDNNTANGFWALLDKTSGESNNAYGSFALSNNLEGSFNVAIGTASLLSNITGSRNTAIGHRTGNNNLGDDNIFIGYRSGYNETASNKLYIENSDADADNALIYGEFDTNILRTNSEFQIGNPTVTGYAFPTADGTADQLLQTDGSGSLSWTATAKSINDLTDGKSIGTSLFLGSNAGLNDDSTDNFNVAVGYEALFTNTSGSSNTAFGYRALHFNIGSHNVANGYQALIYNSDGTKNTANGSFSLTNNTTGYENTANGYRALYLNETGRWNTANGVDALYNNNSGSFNTAIGYKALYGVTIGNSNVAIGRNALPNVITSQNNIGIGWDAEVPNPFLSNQIRIGNTNITSATTQVAWTFPSDKRWKENIRTLPYGLDVVKQLKPVDYIRKNNDARTRDMGFIAQDVEALLTKIGYDDQGLLTKDDKGLLSLRYNDLIALLTKAIQEQQEIIESQNSKLEKQDSDIKGLMARMQKIENATGIN